MRIARVFGTVTLNRVHPTFVGARLKLAVPLTLANLRGEAPESDEELVVWDELGAGSGMLIALSEGAEAAQPFRPEVKPVDAYAAALIDRLDM
jgi:ethanolamine utilization protein EutN